MVWPKVEETKHLGETRFDVKILTIFIFGRLQILEYQTYEKKCYVIIYKIFATKQLKRQFLVFLCFFHSTLRIFYLSTFIRRLSARFLQFFPVTRF